MIRHPQISDDSRIYQTKRSSLYRCHSRAKACLLAYIALSPCGESSYHSPPGRRALPDSRSKSLLLSGCPAFQRIPSALRLDMGPTPRFLSPRDGPPIHVKKTDFLSSFFLFRKRGQRAPTSPSSHLSGIHSSEKAIPLECSGVLSARGIYANCNTFMSIFLNREAGILLISILGFSSLCNK